MSNGNKVKRLTLSHGYHNCDVPLPEQTQADLRYRVDKVVNSVEYYPGQMLTRKEVADLCDATSWEVNVVPIK